MQGRSQISASQVLTSPPSRPWLFFHLSCSSERPFFLLAVRPQLHRPLLPPLWAIVLFPWPSIRSSILTLYVAGFFSARCTDASFLLSRSKSTLSLLDVDLNLATIFATRPRYVLVDYWACNCGRWPCICFRKAPSHYVKQCSSIQLEVCIVSVVAIW